MNSTSTSQFCLPPLSCKRWSFLLLATLYSLGSHLVMAERKAPFSLAVSTQAMASKYQFTEGSSLVEMANAISDLGSDTMKLNVSPQYHQLYRIEKNPGIKSARDLVSKESSYKAVFDMPFRNIMFWLYPFSDKNSAFKNEELPKEEADRIYREIYDLSAYLLKTYSGTGKSFFIGNWEGDWHSVGNYDHKADPSPERLELMKQWFLLREKAIADARRDTKHEDVFLYYYVEVNLVRKAMDEGRPALVNKVLPYIKTDLVSYSSYDTSNEAVKAKDAIGRKKLFDTLDYIEKHLPSSDIPGKRVMIGEYGIKYEAVKDPKLHRDYTAKLMKWGLEWGCPFILYWQIYCNEINEESGEHRGYWLIDDRGKKLPAWHLHRDFLKKANAYVDDFQKKHKRLPSQTEYSDIAKTWIPSPEPVQQQATAKKGVPNILFITMDDMNYDSIGSYGCKIPGISPHIDSLAENGMRFTYAYNQTSSCAPSRNTWMNGRYPHTSGILSFFNVDANYKPLPELLRKGGYFTACVNKPRDSSLTDDYDQYWDCHIIMKGGPKRGGPTYAKNTKEALAKAIESQKPFFCVVNIADPHKPFYLDPKGTKEGFDQFKPSIEYTVDDVSIPPFLPEHPEILKEMRNYYNSVKRGDDCVGAVLKTLKESGQADNTIVMFISDHGMPLPFAKSSLYPDGLRTPWMIQWPGTIEKNRIDSEHLVSSIDFMPTVLDIAGLDIPDGIQGRSLLKIIKGGKENNRKHVFAEFNDNAGGVAFPMRALHTRDFLYIFNAWGTGENEFTSAATWYQSEKTMKRLAAADPVVAARYEFLTKRSIEEFYDLRQDPHALNNLIEAKEHQDRIKTMRNKLKAWMKKTDDHLIEAMNARKDPVKLQKIYLELDAAALKRAKTLQWKRYKNRAGGTNKNTLRYKP